MILARAGRFFLFVAVGTMASTAPASAQTSSVLQGGFRLRVPETGQDAGVLSLGPLLVAGARHRASLNEGGGTVCQSIVYLALGSQGTKRTARKVLLRQKTDVVVFFVFSRCDQNLEEVCLLAASRPLAISRCSALVKLTASGGITGKVDVRCKDGVDPSDAAFGLQAQHVAWVEATFPNLRQKFAMKIRDRQGQEETGEDLRYKIRNLDSDALDDVVGTYLADDDLPRCP
jgi:hypothetical protein